MITLRQQILQKSHRMVLKIGTTLMTESKSQQLETACLESIVAQIAALLEKGKEIVIVSSGAIGSGMALRKVKNRPKLLEELQATAAVGQIQLMKFYEQFFNRHGIKVAQVLLTRADLEDRKRYINAQKTIKKLLEWKIIPIINENDTVAVDEIKVGDNDRLSALIAHLVDADFLILLTDVDGLYPYGKVGAGSKQVPLVEQITPELMRWARPTKSQISIGGMITKLEAAKMATQAGISCLLVNGFTNQVLLRVAQGEELGTLFVTQRAKAMKTKQRWLAFTTRPKGTITIDEGARRALVEHKKSLLASGITDVGGDFRKGDLVRILDSSKNEFARGITSFQSEELGRIKGLKSDRIHEIIGPSAQPEVIHRDRLVIL